MKSTIALLLLAAAALAAAPATSTCVIIKRMGPADEITSHLYSFGLRGKQFQFVEGELPEGIKFHGRLTDADVRKIQDKGGKVVIVESKYTDAQMADARKSCTAKVASK
jgi:hypothetical protein